MARMRTIKPAFFKNEELAELGPYAQVLFAGLWCLADREGRLKDGARRIKSDTLPYYDDVDVDELLDRLHAAGFIRRYEVSGERLIQVATFSKHQQPHYKEVASELPPPPGHAEGGVIAFGVSNEQRERIMVRDGRHCRQCGATEKLTIDHVMPRSLGGGGDDDNLQVLCASCNASKRNRIAAGQASADDDVELTSAQRHADVDVNSRNGQASIGRRQPTGTLTLTRTGFPDPVPLPLPEPGITPLPVRGSNRTEVSLSVGNERESATDVAALARSGARKSIDATVAVPERWASVHAQLDGLPGYQSTAKLWRTLDDFEREYPGIKVAVEVEKLAEWVCGPANKRRQPATRLFIANWLGREAERSVGGATHGATRGHAADGRGGSDRAAIRQADAEAMERKYGGAARRSR